MDKEDPEMLAVFRHPLFYGTDGAPSNLLERTVRLTVKMVDPGWLLS